MFKRAQRKQAKLRLLLAGPAGSGKTMSALLLAKGLGGRIAVIDTERGSASLYSDVVDFDTLEFNPPYSPERYIQALEGAAKAGYDSKVAAYRQTVLTAFQAVEDQLTASATQAQYQQYCAKYIP